MLVPALKVILPASAISASETPHWGLTFFAIFLAGWGTSFLVGLLADRIGRLRALGISIALYAVGTLASGLAQNVPEFAAARFVAGLGLGAEWFIGGTGVAAGVDAVVLSACVQMPSLAAIPATERELGLPVLSAATATARQILLALDLDPVVPDAGRALDLGIASLRA